MSVKKGEHIEQQKEIQKGWKRICLTAMFMMFIYVLMQLVGCSFSRYQMDDLSKNPDVGRYEFKDGQDIRRVFETVEVKGRIPDSNDYIMNMQGVKQSIGDMEFGANKSFSVKYHPSSWNKLSHSAIPVNFSNGRRYTASLDTGCFGYIVMTSDVVLDNKLEIYPLDSGDVFVGLCHISELTVGEAKIKDAMVFYNQEQWQFRILNIPVYKQTTMLLGRDFIKSFDTVIFDNVHEEVVFSKTGAFLPDDPQLWSSYSFSEDPNRENTIMVQIPIAGQLLNVAFDSCGGWPGLNLAKEHWQTIENTLNVKRLANTHYLVYNGERWSCEKATVSKLTVGNKMLQDVNVFIYDDPERHSMVSLGYFRDTVVVLDYANQLFWIRK